MKCRRTLTFLFFCYHAFSQTQTCPLNINFATGDLTHWYAYTGNNRLGNGPSAIMQRYDSNNNAPQGTRGAQTIQEYGIGTIGILVNTTNNSDPFGGFPTIPTINGYRYGYSIKLGSTSITHGGGPDNTGGGGYIRGISYSIHVPPGPATEPYTMTYAYAMVLENGTHASVNQPLISATLQTPAGIIKCASPSYLLPTFNNVSNQGRGATLDSATAIKNGFKVSPLRTPNRNPDPNVSPEEYIQDVWTKDWTEVTFDLSAYRGQQVSLIIEADNCIPGGHFAYGYIAIRNSCAGLQITGDSLVCNHSIITYAVPALANAQYNWVIPGDWTLLSSDTSNIIQVKSSAAGGIVSVREKNSCADLNDVLQVKTLPSPVAGELDGSTTVCAGENNSTMNLLNYSGAIVKWLASTDSIIFSDVADIGPQFTASNLETTTVYKVVVGKGNVCPSDTSSIAIISVDQKTIGGNLNPAVSTLCSGQIAGELLTLSGNRGSVLNWQSSADGFNWFDVVPTQAAINYTVKGITSSTQYRLINKNGVCPTDTSSVASILFDPVSYPIATVSPADTTICYGTAATINAAVFIGTSYTWNPASTGIGNIGSTPFNFISQVTPKKTDNYILRVLNSGCPNPLFDTIHINVLAPIIVDAGHDTSVVVGEPLQLKASSDDPGSDEFLWTPATGLDNVFISNPLGLYTLNDNIIKYTVRATTPFGCSGEGFITVKVFKTKPDIFVPNAFTPGTAINSLFRPVPVGISSLDYFRIYNRLGQLVYSTSTIGNGWDGLLNGTPQSAGGYVWMVKGTDYTGAVISKKGTMVLIR
jgi:PKD-like domain/CHU_C Type IX secretion signal domain